MKISTSALVDHALPLSRTFSFFRWPSRVTMIGRDSHALWHNDGFLNFNVHQIGHGVHRTESTPVHPATGARRTTVGTCWRANRKMLRETDGYPSGDRHTPPSLRGWLYDNGGCSLGGASMRESGLSGEKKKNRCYESLGDGSSEKRQRGKRKKTSIDTLTERQRQRDSERPGHTRRYDDSHSLEPGRRSGMEKGQSKQ